jgi:hypothetical protein
MYGSVVPCRNAFTRDIVAGRDIGMRPVKDRQTLMILFEKAPVRICLGYMAPEQNIFSILGYKQGQMRCRGTVFCGRDQDRKRMRSHKSECVGVVAQSKMFRNVHRAFEVAIPGSRWLLLPNRFSFANHNRDHGWGGTAKPRPYTASRISSPPRRSRAAPTSLPSIIGSFPSRDSRRTFEPSGSATMASR